MPSTGQFLGLVERGELRLVLPQVFADGARKLTSVGMMAPEPPERGQLDLKPYEGSAIMVEGFDSGKWIFEAEVIERAGPILTAVVRQVFGVEPLTGSSSTASV